MHEYSIVSALMDRVESEARAHHGSNIRRVEVRIGELSGIDTTLLATAWETFTAHTLCDGAALEIHDEAARWACPRCGAAVERGAILRCEGCGAPARLVAGDAILLERIEMEVSDV